MATKVTFTLDDVTITRLEAAAEQLKKPKSQVVREAIGEYYQRMGRLSEAEKQRMLQAIDRIAPTIPRRPPGEIKRELEEIRASRRAAFRNRGPR